MAFRKATRKVLVGAGLFLVIIAGVVGATLYSKYYPPQGPIELRPPPQNTMHELESATPLLTSAPPEPSADETERYQNAIQKKALADVFVSTRAALQSTTNKILIKDEWAITRLDLLTKEKEVVRTDIEDLLTPDSMLEVVWAPDAQAGVFFVPNWKEHYRAYGGPFASWANKLPDKEFMPFVYNVSSNTFKRLPRYLKAVGWSPDSSQLLALRINDQNGRADLLLLSKDGKFVRVLKRNIPYEDYPSYVWLGNEEFIELNPSLSEEPQSLIAQELKDPRKQRILVEDINPIKAAAVKTLLYFTAYITQGEEAKTYLYALDEGAQILTKIAQVQEGATLSPGPENSVFVVYGQAYSWGVALASPQAVRTVYESQAEIPPEVVGTNSDGKSIYLIELFELLEVKL